jgi:hypothetical protein
MARIAALFAVAALSVALPACGGAKTAGPNTAAFLTIVRHPLTGNVGGVSDDDALRQGRRACADLDAGMRSDDVVADIGGDPEPGSAAFNSAAILVAAATHELCPGHSLG